MCIRDRNDPRKFLKNTNHGNINEIWTANLPEIVLISLNRVPTWDTTQNFNGFRGGRKLGIFNIIYWKKKEKKNHKWDKSAENSYTRRSTRSQHYITSTTTTVATQIVKNPSKCYNLHSKHPSTVKYMAFKQGNNTDFLVTTHCVDTSIRY